MQPLDKITKTVIFTITMKGSELPFFVNLYILRKKWQQCLKYNGNKSWNTLRIQVHYIMSCSPSRSTISCLAHNWGTRHYVLHTIEVHDIMSHNWGPRYHVLLTIEVHDIMSCSQLRYTISCLAHNWGTRHYVLHTIEVHDIMSCSQLRSTISCLARNSRKKYLFSNCLQYILSVYAQSETK